MSVVSHKTFLLGGWSLRKEQAPTLRTKCFDALILQRQFFLKCFNISITGILASLPYIAPCQVRVLFYLV